MQPAACVNIDLSNPFLCRDTPIGRLMLFRDLNFGLDIDSNGGAERYRKVDAAQAQLGGAGVYRGDGAEVSQGAVMVGCFLFTANVLNTKDGLSFPGSRNLLERLTRRMQSFKCANNLLVTMIKRVGESRPYICDQLLFQSGEGGSMEPSKGMKCCNVQKTLFRAKRYARLMYPNAFLVGALWTSPGKCRMSGLYQSRDLLWVPPKREPFPCCT
jgi:hypothetical protein